jgi:hypothetical protein
MDSKCCSRCAHTLLLSSFLDDPSNLESIIRATCLKCRTQQRAVRAKSKRKAPEPLNPNVPSKDLQPSLPSLRRLL